MNKIYALLPSIGLFACVASNKQDEQHDFEGNRGTAGMSCNVCHTSNSSSFDERNCCKVDEDPDVRGCNYACRTLSDDSHCCVCAKSGEPIDLNCSVRCCGLVGISANRSAI